jgi:cell shape-determining protein MreC
LHVAVEQSRRAIAGLSHRTGDRTEVHDLHVRLAEASEHVRQLEVQLAIREQQWRSAKAENPHGESLEPLLVPQLVEARVLGDESAALWRSGKLIGAGAAAGIVESSLVLTGRRPLVDLGEDARVSAGDALYAGRSVVGKVAAVGRYTSTVVLVTDAGYAGRARIARRTSRGLTFGSEGTLMGDGTALCRLRHIAEPVNVGDEVYTGGTDGVLPFAMYYGRVVRAELEPAATEWSIDVKPDAALARFDRVQILRLAVNAGRLLAD